MAWPGGGVQNVELLMGTAQSAAGGVEDHNAVAGTVATVASGVWAKFDPDQLC